MAPRLGLEERVSVRHLRPRGVEPIRLMRPRVLLLLLVGAGWCRPTGAAAQPIPAGISVTPCGRDAIRPSTSRRRARPASPAVDLDGDGVPERLVVGGLGPDIHAGIVQSSPTRRWFEVVSTGRSESDFFWRGTIHVGALTLALGVMHDGYALGAALDFMLYELTGGLLRVVGGVYVQGRERGVPGEFDVAFAPLSDGRLAVFRLTQHAVLSRAPSAPCFTLDSGGWIDTATLSAPLATAAPSSACVARPATSFHLRPSPAVASEGPLLPAGTALEVLQRHPLRRRDARLYQVRLPGGSEGWLFLRPSEISGATCRVDLLPTPVEGTISAVGDGGRRRRSILDTRSHGGSAAQSPRLPVLGRQLDHDAPAGRVGPETGGLLRPLGHAPQARVERLPVG